MAEEEKEAEETTNRGSDWEVVSLTASAYAATSNAREFGFADVDKDVGVNENDSVHAMFMSDHFIFPPSQHEKLPVEPDTSEILYEPSKEECVDPAHASTIALLEMDDGLKKDNEEKWDAEGLSETADLHGIQLFVEKGVVLTDRGAEYKQEKDMKGLNLVLEEASVYGAAKYGSIHGAESSVVSETSEHSASPKTSKPMEPSKDEKCSPLSQAWWKRHAASLYANAKEASAIWSVVVATALMGLVIVGQRWQKDRWQIQQLKLQFGVNEEKIGYVLGPITRFKDVLVGGPRHGVLRGSASADH